MSKVFNLEALNMEHLPSPLSLKRQFFCTSKHIDFIQGMRGQIERILNGEDPRLLLIVGPCSIHDIVAAKEYAAKLKELSDRISKTFLVVMRAYFEKPRTALGWKGMLHDPHLDGSDDIHAGLCLSRELLLFLADLEMPAATEFLDPSTPRFLGDLVSWACIGARTSESQIHRQFASGLSMPVAFKNNTSGNIDVAINGIIASSQPHSFLGINDDGNISLIQTKGNSFGHVALRGGENRPNYDAESLDYTLKQLKKVHLPQRLLVDCSHDNSHRNYEQQAHVFRSVIEQYIQGNHAIKGLALESHLYAGNQAFPMDKARLQYAVSLTDPCMDWTMTEELILWGATALERSERNVSKAEIIRNDIYAQL